MMAGQLNIIKVMMKERGMNSDHMPNMSPEQMFRFFKSTTKLKIDMQHDMSQDKVMLFVTSASKDDKQEPVVLGEYLGDFPSDRMLATLMLLNGG